MIYPRRYELEPRKRKAYCEACDLIAIYGIPRKQWKYKKYDISKTEMAEIWDRATVDMLGKSAVSFSYSM